MCCYVQGVSEPLLLPPSCSAQPFCGGLAWPVLGPRHSCGPGLCHPLSFPGGWSPVSCGVCMSLYLGFFGGRGVSHCPGAQSECPGLPFPALPVCVGVRCMSVCSGGLCVPSWDLSHRGVLALEVGLGRRVSARGCEASCVVVCVPLPALSLCTCAGGLWRGKRGKGGPDRKCLPFSSPRTSPLPLLPPRGAPRSPPGHLPPAWPSPPPGAGRLGVKPRARRAPPELSAVLKPAPSSLLELPRRPDPAPRAPAPSGM